MLFYSKTTDLQLMTVFCFITLLITCFQHCSTLSGVYRKFYISIPPILLSALFKIISQFILSSDKFTYCCIMVDTATNTTTTTDTYTYMLSV